MCNTLVYICTKYMYSNIISIMFAVAKKIKILEECMF